MKTKELPWFSRPDFKFTKKGVENLDEADLLAIILWSNDNLDRDLEISNKVLKKYNLDNIEEAGFDELLNLVKGKKRAEHIDFVKARKLFSLIELVKRYNRLKRDGYKRKINFLSCPKDVFNYFIDRYNTKKKEYFICLYLNNKGGIIKDEILSIGTLNSSKVYPREVFKIAIKEGAKSIILIHNHPSGDVEPSESDKEVTEKLKEAGKLFNINILDHVIIGKETYKSIQSSD
jgi:DNA repair protein RadC